MVVETGDPADEVPGTLFLITAAELAAADAYEVSALQANRGRAEVRQERLGLCESVIGRLRSEARSNPGDARLFPWRHSEP